MAMTIAMATFTVLLMMAIVTVAGNHLLHRVEGNELSDNMLMIRAHPLDNNCEILSYAQPPQPCFHLGVDPLHYPMFLSQPPQSVDGILESYNRNRSPTVQTSHLLSHPPVHIATVFPPQFRSFKALVMTPHNCIVCILFVFREPNVEHDDLFGFLLVLLIDGLLCMKYDMWSGLYV